METPSTPPAPPRAKPRRRLWKKFCAALGLILLASVLLWLFLSPDESPPDVSSFVFEPLQLPDDQNAYALLSRAAPLLRQTFMDDDRWEVWEMIHGSTWNAVQARQWLDGTDAIWPLWEQAALTTHSQMPWDGPTDFDPNWEKILALADLALIRVRSLADDGRTDDALRALLTTLRVTGLIEETRSNVRVTLVGSGQDKKIQALQALPAIATHAGATTAALRQVLAGLENLRPTRASAVFALQHNYLLLDQVFDTMTKYSVFDFYASLEDTPKPAPFYQRLGLNQSRTFKPNQTRRLFLEGLNRALNAIDLDYARLSSIERDWKKMAGVVPSGIPPTILTFHLDNLFGRIALRTASPFEWDFLGYRLREQSTISLAEAFLALVLYHREHGELPATLDALVPAYLPAVPRDYFDGQPIRYSREFRGVWSAGTDNFKVTSADPIQDEDKKEIYLPLNFAPPATPPSSAPAGSAGGPPAP